MKTADTWYATTTNTGSLHEQGLIIDKATGANIAVTYDAKHAPPIAAAPDLLAALQALHEYARTISAGYRNALTQEEDDLYNQVAAALSKATP